MTFTVAWNKMRPAILAALYTYILYTAYHITKFWPKDCWSKSKPTKHMLVTLNNYQFRTPINSVPRLKSILI